MTAGAPMLDFCMAHGQPRHKEGGGVPRIPIEVVWEQNAFALIDLKTIDWLMKLPPGLKGNQVHDLAAQKPTQEDSSGLGAGQDRCPALKRLYQIRTDPYVLRRVTALRKIVPEQAG